MDRNLFDKMKEDYEAFNKNVIYEYKTKLKDVEIEKMELQER